MLRRQAREEVLKALYRYEFLEEEPLESVQEREEDYGEQRDFVEGLFLGTIDRRKEIDEVIDRSVIGWRLERLAPLDRNILRMSIFELLFQEETPPEVVINEAIELCKKYGTENSPKFVNGILDRLWKEESEKTTSGKKE